VSPGERSPVPTEEKLRCTLGLGISEKRKSLAVVGNLTADRPVHGSVPTHTPTSQLLGTVLPFRPFYTRDTAPTHVSMIAVRCHVALSIPRYNKTAMLVPTFRRSGSSASH
jgi:hypothetical protein